MPRLTVNPDTAHAWEITLKAGTNTFGRGETNDFPIDHPSISNPHCEIVVMASGVIIKDLSSAEGTFINDTPVHESLILPGQVFRLGGVWMRLEMEAMPPRIIPAPVPGSPAAPGSFCKAHPKAVARYYCPNCQELFCELCIVTRMVQGETKRFCRVCRGECAPLESEEAAQEPPIFAQEVADAFVFPFKNDGILILIGATICYVILSFVSAFLFGLGLMVMIFATGYWVAYLQGNIQLSAQGKNRLPDWPDLSDFNEFLGPFWQIFCTYIFSFGPATLLFLSALHQTFSLRAEPPPPWMDWALPVAIAWGCIYYPIGFLAVTMFDDIAALNPFVIIPSIFRIFWAYSLAVILCLLVYAMHWYGVPLLAMVLPRILVGIIAKFFSLYVAMVVARILGVLYWTKKAELGWFRH